MKRTLSLILVMLLAISLAACTQEKPVEVTPTEAPVEEAPTAEPVVENEPTAVPTVEGMQRIHVLNNAFTGLTESSQCYNAKEWHKAYSLGEFVANNFWFTPAEDGVAYTTAYTDFYTDECPVADFLGKYVSFDKDNEAYDYDLFVGPKQKESTDVTFKGFCTVGNEIILFMQEDGWNIEQLFADVKMVDAESYDFVAADGYTVSVAKADLKDAAIAYVDNRIDGIIPGESWTLYNIQYIIPTDLTAESTVEGVVKINVALNGVGVLDTEAPYLQNRAGVYYTAYSVADMLAAHEVTESENVKIISAKDGYTAEEAYASFAAKYIAYQGPTQKGDQKEYFTLGQTQPKGEGVTNAGYYILSEDAFVFAPEAGIPMSEVFATVGMAETPNYTITYTNGTIETKTAADVAAMSFTADINDIVAVY